MKIFSVIIFYLLNRGKSFILFNLNWQSSILNISRLLIFTFITIPNVDFSLPFSLVLYIYYINFSMLCLYWHLFHELVWFDCIFFILFFHSNGLSVIDIIHNLIFLKNSLGIKTEIFCHIPLIILLKINDDNITKLTVITVFINNMV